LFTHFGVSGPAILNISGRVGDLIKKGEVKISFDFFPLLSEKQVSDLLEQNFKKYPSKIVKNILSDFLPERFIEALLDVANVDKTKIVNSLLKNERKEIVRLFKNFKVTPESVFDFNSAMVTKGGVSLKEIYHKTMKSKLIENLYFAGEIIDIDGKTGGFNLQFCWSTGYLAGKFS
jgi:predicted Rossmann fold flavoprotein